MIVGLKVGLIVNLLLGQTSKALLIRATSVLQRRTGKVVN